MKLPNMTVAVGANQSYGELSLKVTIGQAVQSLREAGVVIRQMSRLFQTPCFPAGAGPDYLNAALLIEAPWTPVEALAKLHEIEQQFGRTRVQRWGQRTLDLDLIAYDDLVAPDLSTHKQWRDLDVETQKMRAPEQLILPHPRLQDRAFVLIPMYDVAPDWVHPVLGLSVSQMLDQLPEADKASVVPL